METKNKIQEATNQIDELIAKRKKLKFKLMDESDFNVGEKVMVTQSYHEHSSRGATEISREVAFISGMSVSDEGEIQFKFNKVKKDGEMSQHSFWVGFNRVVKVEKFNQ